MPIGDFDQYYAEDPIQAIDRNQWMWYYPELQQLFREKTAFSPFIAHRYQLGAAGATQMTITSLYDVHANIDPLGLRQMWMPAMHLDSRSVVVTYSRYGGKVAYHKHDDLINRWRMGGVNERQMWLGVLRRQLAQHYTDVHDLLARNAFIKGAIDSGYVMYAGTASSIGTLSASDTFETPLLREVHLGMKSRGINYAVNPNGTVGTVIATTSPGVMYDIKRESGSFGFDFLSTMQYSDPARALRYEVGMIDDVRFQETNKSILFNAGTVSKQCTVTAPINAGDGAAATVDGAITPGQSGATAYIQLSSFSAGEFVAGDIVTLHVDRTSTYGVTNGLDWTDGTIHNLRVVTVDADNNRLSFASPVMVDFTTDLNGSGVYGYITKGLNIHATILIGGPGGVVAGVGAPVEMEAPPPVDDFKSMYRFSWNEYIGYQLFEPTVFEVILSAGSYRWKGRAAVV